MAPPGAQNDTGLLAEIAASTSANAQMLQRLSEEVKGIRADQIVMVGRLAAVESKCEHFGDQISKLFEILRDGNGRPSAMDRLTTVENQATHLCNVSRRLDQYINQAEKDKTEREKAKKKRDFAVIMSSGQVIAAALSFAGAVIAAALAFWSSFNSK